MSAAPIYTAARAERLIREKKVSGEYHVSGSLDLSGCDLAGVTLPTTVGGSLDLSGCENVDPSQSWTENGETSKRRCLCVVEYALIRTEIGQYFAGCRGPWTAQEALAHWGDPRRTDARAGAFVAAIQAAEAEAAA